MNYLAKRLKNEEKSRFAKCQRIFFVSLLEDQYKDVLEVGCGIDYYFFM